jgi:hypothetical protein
MPIFIRCVINRETGSKQLDTKGLARLRQEIPRRVIRAGNQNSAFYADQSNYFWCSNHDFRR